MDKGKFIDYTCTSQEATHIALRIIEIPMKQKRRYARLACPYTAIGYSGRGERREYVLSSVWANTESHNKSITSL